MGGTSTRRCPNLRTATVWRPAKRWRCTCGNDSLRDCREAWHCTPCACRKGLTSTQSIMASREPKSPPSRMGPSSMAPGVSPGPGVGPGTAESHAPGSRRGRMLAESAAVEEWLVWLEVNGEPAVTWMCTPGQLEELATGWLHGEG